MTVLSQVIKWCYIERLNGDAEKWKPRRLRGDFIHVDALPMCTRNSDFWAVFSSNELLISKSWLSLLLPVNEVNFGVWITIVRKAWRQRKDFLRRRTSNICVASTGRHFYEIRVDPQRNVKRRLTKESNYLPSAAICDVTHQLARKQASLVQNARKEMLSRADKRHSSKTVLGQFGKEELCSSEIVKGLSIFRLPHLGKKN